LRLKRQYPTCGVPSHECGVRASHFYRSGGSVIPVCGFCRTMEPGKFCRQNGLERLPEFVRFTQDTIDEHAVQLVMES